MFGFSKKQKGIQDLKESDLQKLFNEAEVMYSSFIKRLTDTLAKQSESLKNFENENDTYWIKKTSESMKENQELVNNVQEVRENIIRLSEREAHSSIKNRFYIVRDWYVYMQTLLYWNADEVPWETTAVMDKFKERTIKLEEIAKRLKTKLAQTT